MQKSILLSAFLISACQQNSPVIGGERDKNGCLIGAGESWSKLKNACIQVFNEAEIQIPDPKNPTSAIYGVISEDRQRVEIFSLAYQGILESTKGGYSNEEYVLQLSNNQWIFRKK